MIVILGYNNSETDYLNEYLDSCGIDYEYSLLESQLINAERIILPHPLNFSSSFRRMNMMNLFSLLRLVKKPILGINDAAKLMCNQILDQFKCGLGFFEIDTSLNLEDDREILVEGSLDVSDESKLLTGNFSNHRMMTNILRQPLETAFSRITMKHNNTIYSVSFEYKNYFAIELDILRNEAIAKEIILNFCKI